MAETKIDNNDHGRKLDQEFDMLKKELKSIALSVGPAVYVSVEQLDRDYIDINNYPVPYQKFGFSSFLDLLKSMPDALALFDCGGDPGGGATTAVVPISDAKTLHLEHLIAGQRPSSPTRFGGLVPGLDNNNSQSRDRSSANGQRPNDRRSFKNARNYNNNCYRNGRKMTQQQPNLGPAPTRNPNTPAPPQLPSTMIQNYRNRENALNNCQILPGYENIWLESALKFGAKQENVTDNDLISANHHRPSFKNAVNQNLLFQKAANQISPARKTSASNLSFDDRFCTNGSGFSTPPPNSANKFSTPPPLNNSTKTPPTYSTHNNADFPDGEFLEIVVENLLRILREPPRRSFSLKNVELLYKNRFPDDPPLNLLESFSSTIVEFIRDNLTTKIDIFKLGNDEIFLRYKTQTAAEALNEARYCREMPKIPKNTPDEYYQPAVYTNFPRKNDDYASSCPPRHQSKLATPLKPRPVTPPTAKMYVGDSSTTATVNSNKSSFDSSSIRRMAYEIAFGEPCPAPAPLNNLNAADDYAGCGAASASSSSTASTVLKRDPAVLAYEKQKTTTTLRLQTTTTLQTTTSLRPQTTTTLPFDRQHFDAQEFVRRAAATSAEQRPRCDYGFPYRTFNNF